MNSETWRPIAGFPGYEVSNIGRVRSWRTRGNSKLPASEPRVIKPSLRKRDGYVYINLRSGFGGKMSPCKVHHLVLAAFSGPKLDGYVARHMNGERSDNRAENLAWGTYRDNSLDTKRHGRQPLGEKHHWSVMTAAHAAAIRWMYGCGIGQSVIGRVLGMPNNRVWQVVHNKSWVGVEP